MSKRGALSNLNQDNWNEDEESEEIGEFKKASHDILKTRIIKSAKRKAPESPSEGQTKSIFSGFTGFSTTTDSKNTLKPFGKMDFSSLGNGNQEFKSMFKSSVNAESTSEKNITISTDDSYDKQMKEYYSELKGLNESVTKWIKTHVDANPVCILTPIFKDYEKYLKQIEDKKPVKNSSPVMNSAIVETTAPITNIFAKPAMFGNGASTSAFGQTTTFGSGTTPFTFGNVSKPITSENKPAPENEDESDEPPKADFKAVIEEDSIYTIRCKVFVKKDGAFSDGGVGNLFLKPVKDTKKTQLIVRADTNLGNLLINTLLSESMATQRMGTNNVMILCVPTPDKGPIPTTILLRVKTAEQADELLQKIVECKT